MLTQVDAVLVMSVDGRAHLEQFKAVLKAGKPVYVGRPLAASLADAVEIFDWPTSARRRSSPARSTASAPASSACGITKMSARSSAATSTAAARATASSRSCLARCPRHRNAVHDHGAGLRVGDLGRDGQADVVTGIWKDGRVGTYRGIRKGRSSTAPRSSGQGRLDGRHLRPRRAGEGGRSHNDQYMGYEATAIEIAKFFRTKAAGRAEETIEMFAFMEAADESKRQKGRR